MKTFAINKVVRITLPIEMIRFGSKSGNNSDSKSERIYILENLTLFGIESLQTVQEAKTGKP